MKKLKLTKLSKDEIDKNQLGKIRGGLGCSCGATCNLTAERREARRSRRKNPPGLQSGLG